MEFKTRLLTATFSLRVHQGYPRSLTGFKSWWITKVSIFDLWGISLRHDLGLEKPSIICTFLSLNFDFAWFSSKFCLLIHALFSFSIFYDLVRIRKRDWFFSLYGWCVCDLALFLYFGWFLKLISRTPSSEPFVTPLWCCIHLLLHWDFFRNLSSAIIQLFLNGLCVCVCYINQWFRGWLKC